LSQVAHVTAWANGGGYGAPAIGRVPAKLRPTFDSAGAPQGLNHCGEVRKQLMLRACKEASVRERAAEAWLSSFTYGGA
jgi:hypothetical protein